MNDEKWLDLLGEIKERLEVLEHRKENFDIKDDFGVKGKGEREIIVFKGEMGKMKLEREKRPVILDKKVHYVKTKGTGAMIEYVLSEEETTSKVFCYRWNEQLQEWEEINLSRFAF